MSAPRLTRALVLETPQRSPDGAGGYAESWAALGTLWAEVAPRRGRDTQAGGLPLAAQPARILVRAAPPGSPARPAPGQRFAEGARRWRIEAVTEADARGLYLACDVTEEVAL